MAIRRFELEDLLIRPGTYFNPQTEVLLVVDDSPEIDNEIFAMEDIEGAEWVLISDETPIDESARDELLERFQISHQAAREGTLGRELEGDEGDGDDEEEVNELDAEEGGE